MEKSENQPKNPLFNSNFSEIYLQYIQIIQMLTSQIV